MNFEDDEEWDLDLIDDLVRKEEAAIAAKRATQATQQPSLLTSAAPASSIQSLLRTGDGRDSALGGTQNKGGMSRPWQSHISYDHSSLSAQRAGSVHLDFVSNPNSHHHRSIGMNRENVAIFSIGKANTNTTFPPAGRALFGRSGGGVPAEETMVGTASFSQGRPDSLLGNTGVFHRYLEGELLSGKTTLSREVTRVYDREGKYLADACASNSHPGGLRSTEILSNKENALMPHYGVLQAGKELTELPCRRATSINAFSINAEQREVERLSAQLLFKDQELLEARRASAEKAELLKRTLDEAAQLKKEFEALKRSRQSEGGRADDPLELRGTLSQPDISVIGGSSSQAKIGTRNMHGSENDTNLCKDIQNKDIWSAPWSSKRVPEPANDKNIIQEVRKSGPIKSQENPSDLENPLRSSIAMDLKTRIKDDGCTTQNQKEQTSSNVNVEVRELPCREPTASVKTFTELEEMPSSKLGPVQKNRCGDRRYMECPKLYHDLVKIWNIKNAKEGGLELLSKLFAACQTDLFVLLRNGSELVDSGGEIEASPHLCNTVNRTGLDMSKRAASDCVAGKGELGGSLLSLKLHTVLSKVANGLASFWTLLPPLLEFCNCEDVQVVQSAFRVMHYVLLHDFDCRRRLFERNSFYLATKSAVQESGFHVRKTEGGETQKGKGSLPAPIFGNNEFVSPRIILKTHVVDKSTDNERQHLDFETEMEDKQKSSSERAELCEDSLSSENSAALQRARVDRFFRWILGLALTAASPVIKFEAISLLSLLAMHTEPLHERKLFGETLIEGSIASLFRRSAGLDVQLQAVRLLHLLLHCSGVLRKFCNEEHTADNTTAELEKSNELHISTGDKEAGKTQDGSLTGIEHKTSTIQTSSRDCYREVLKSLSLCLFYTGNSLQEYALRRNALRVLAFITASGNAGVAAIVNVTVGPYEDCYEKDLIVQGRRNVNSSVDKTLNIPILLVSLLDAELTADNDEGNLSTSTLRKEERACLIREALTLLCRLASHTIHSLAALAALTQDKSTARLCISVANRLVDRSLRSVSLLSGHKSSVPSTDMMELAKGFKRRILASLQDS